MYNGKPLPQFNAKKKKPKPPKEQTVVAPPVIPVQDVAVTDTKAKKAEAIRQRQGGVAATVLSDTLG